MSSVEVLAEIRGVPENNLQFGKSITVKNKNNSGKTFIINSLAQQIISVEIKQNGMDVRGKLFDSNNQLIAESDNPFSEQDTERIYVVAEKSGNYRLQIETKFPDREGSITVKLNEAKTAQFSDLKLAEAEKLFSEAQLLRGTAVSSNRQKAVSLYEKSLQLRRETSDQAGEIRTLAVLSYLQRILGRDKISLELANQILDFPELPEYITYKSDALYQIGQIQHYSGEREKAIETFKKAIALFPNESYEQANFWTLLANAYQMEGFYELADESFAKSLEILRKFPEMYIEAQTVHLRGIFYVNYNFLEEAFIDFQTAADLRKKFGNFRGYAVSLTFQAIVLQRLERFQDSIEPLEKALAISVQMEDYINQVDALVYLARAQRETKFLSKSLELYNRAIEISDKQNIADNSLYLSLGVTYRELGDFQAARKSFEKSLEMFRKKNDVGGEALVFYHFAYLEREENNLDAALEKIEFAVKEIDNAGQIFRNPQRFEAFLANRRRYFDLYVDILMRLDARNPNQGFSLKALQVNEMSRMRTFLWQYREAVKNTLQAADFEILTELQKNQQILGEKLTQLAAAQSKKAENPTEIEAEINTLNRRNETLKARLRQINPNIAELISAPLLSLSEMQAELDDETVLVEYALGEKQSYLWIIGKNDFQSFTLPKRAEIDAQAANLYRILSETDEPNANRQTGKTKVKIPAKKFAEEFEKLSRMLLTETFAGLKEKRLIFVSDGGLNLIPFAALKFDTNAESKFVGEAFEVSQIPSLTTLHVIRQNNFKPFSAKSLAVIADPVFSFSDERLAKNNRKRNTLNDKNLATVLRDFNLKAISRLPFSRIEAEKIANLNGEKTSVNLDFQANRQRFFNGEFNNFDILHFATHGFLNGKYPELSGLVLSLVDEKGNSQNGFLRLQDLYLLKLKPSLVVLSACQTGVGKQVENEGLIGLTRGFMANGTPRVISTLWKVEDAASAELMSRFYRVMLTENKMPSEALKIARNELKAIPRFSNPKHWAGFILTGEWR